jgi:GT2 family glycosyltransferase/tetratricopeptide (TPR) repeat protein
LDSVAAGDDKEEMGILLRFYASLQNLRFDQALRKRDADALSAFAGESGFRARPRQALAAARLLIEQGRPVAAAALVQNALLAEPGQKELILALREAVQGIVVTAVSPAAEELARRADAARDAGHSAEAATLYGEALSILPDATHWRVQRANMLKDSGDLAAAVPEYRRAQLERPEDADIPLQLGRALKQAGKNDEARESFREALRRDPANRAARDELAWLGEPQDQVQQTLAALERGEPSALFALADVLSNLQANFSRIERLLPSASAGSTFPPELHALFRRHCPSPAAPAGRAAFRLAILIDADAGTDRSFHARLDALIALASRDVVLIATVTDAGRRDDILRRAAPEADRLLICRASLTLPELVALLGEYGCQGLLVLEGETLPDAVAPDWLSLALQRAESAYADGESGTLRPDGGIEHHAPILRSRHDPQRGIVAPGRALALRSAMLAEIAAAQPDLPATIAAFWAVAAHRAAPLHIPLFLACDIGAAPAVSLESALAFAGAPVAIGCVIPTRSHAEDAERFVHSLRRTARYPEALSIIVVDNGVSGEGLAALARLSEEGVRILRDHEPFNWSRLNNRAAAELGEAQILLFANDDMEMLTQHWDDELRAVLARDGVGAVGVKLLYPDRTIQHAGLLCSWAGRPEHEGRGEAEDAAGPAGRWQCRRTALAVTGAFLATVRADYEAVGGFDPEFPLGLNDVDFCLRLRELGRSTVYTPHVALFHHESKTRGKHAADTAQAARAAAEDVRFAARWPARLMLDPTVNPNWSESLAPFRAYRAPAGAAVLRYLEDQLAEATTTFRHDPTR